MKFQNGIETMLYRVNRKHNCITHINSLNFVSVSYIHTRADITLMCVPHCGVKAIVLLLQWAKVFESHLNGTEITPQVSFSQLNI